MVNYQLSIILNKRPLKSFFHQFRNFGHYGFSSGNVVGRPKSGMPLSPEDQEYILEEVNGFDIPIIRYDVDADSKEVRVKIDGPWAGLRSGLSVGYRF